MSGARGSGGASTVWLGKTASKPAPASGGRRWKILQNDPRTPRNLTLAHGVAPGQARRPGSCTVSTALRDAVADMEVCMTKKNINWLTLGCLVAIGATAVYAGDPRMRRLVVVGDSLLAGFSSGGFVPRGHAGQVDSAPAFVARRAGVSLPQPLMSSPGVPSQLVISDANGNGQLDPGDVRRITDSIGSRARPIRRVRNLAVPGEDTQSVFDGISSRTIARQLFDGNVNGRDVIKFLILGLPPLGPGLADYAARDDIGRPS